VAAGAALGTCLHGVDLSREAQRAQRLADGRRLRVDVDEHQRLAVAAQARLRWRYMASYAVLEV